MICFDIVMLTFNVSIKRIIIEDFQLSIRKMSINKKARDLLIVQNYEVEKAINLKTAKFNVWQQFKNVLPRSTFYDILRRYDERGTTERLPGQGRKAKIMTPLNIRRLSALFNHNDKVYLRDAAKTFKCHYTYIHNTLKKYTKIRCRKKRKSPSYSEENIRMVKSQCRLMLRKYQGKVFVIDDESYFPLSKCDMPGNDSFYTDDVKLTPPDVKFKKKKKFEKKVMIYLAISERGLSSVFIKRSKLAINAETYSNVCLKRYLFPFINKYHSDGNYVFWPDKASSHYANYTLDVLRENNILFVMKSINPTNLPQCRPIEDFFGQLSAEVYKHDWRAKNINQLIGRIKRCIKKMDFKSVRRNFMSIRRKLRQCADHGPYYVAH
jgi:hypothetical protein